MEFNNSAENKNATTSDFTKNDWIEIERYGNWNINFDHIISINYLEAEQYTDVFSAKEQLSMAEALIVKFALDDFLREKGFIIEREISLRHDGEYPVSRSNIEYEYKKYKSCLNSGSYFFYRGKNKYVFNVSNGPDYVAFCVLSHKMSDPNAQQLLQDLIDYAKNRNFLKGKKIDARFNFIGFDKKYTWDDLVVDEERKNDIRKNLENLIEHRDIYKKNNISIKRGLIFSGPPGTGKTLLGKILCSVTDWTFIWVTPKHLSRSSDVSAILSIARELSPSILFLEDIDLYGGDRHNNSKIGVLGELMNQLDGIQENKDIITIATTNNIDVLEKALLKRPGRFDKVIEFNEPNDKSRRHMIKLFTKDIIVDKSVSLSELVSITENFTGAQVKELINFAILQAVDDKSYNEHKKIILKKSHFFDSLSPAKNKDHKVGFVASDDEDSDCGGVSDDYNDWF